MALVDRVRLFRLPDFTRLRRFMIGPEQVGWILHPFAERLAGFPAVFAVAPDAVRLNPELADFASRSRALASVVAELAKEGRLPKLRKEGYPVATSFDAPPLLELERSAVPAFGTLAFGIHLNGFVGRGAGMKMWIGRRSRNKPTGPLKLDHIVAGGQPIGLSLAENLVKECAEEADMPAALARSAWPTGFTSYLIENYEGIRNDILFTYDIDLPADFRPVNTDGEIEEFYLWPIERVMEVLATTEEFKFNVALVIVDFLVRHGILAPDGPDYVEIVSGLRIREHFPAVG
jgi:Domain of unknown function (DUF4743)